MSLKRCYIVMAAKQPLGFQKLSKSSDKLLILCKCGFLKTFAIFIQIVKERLCGVLGRPIITCYVNTHSGDMMRRGFLISHACREKSLNVMAKCVAQRLV